MSNGALDGDGVQYSVIFVNHSSQTGSACIYQEDPDLSVPNVMSLAWFVKAAAPTTRIQFSWEIDYDFVWSETGNLVPGVVFVASQTWPANLTTTNQVTFTRSGGAYTFKDQMEGTRDGILYINEDSTIPIGQAAVGIGMSGFGTFAVQAQPNQFLNFTPSPQYWITFGNFIQGEVMDISVTTSAARIDFPPNVYSMTATLEPDNTWTIIPTSLANARFLEARAELPELAWGEHPEALQPASR